MSPDLAVPIRAAILGESAITSLLEAYAGSFPVFTRRPAPADAPRRVIMVSPDVLVADRDGISDFRPEPVRDVAVYGSNESPEEYRAVEEIAYAVRALFHRQPSAITVPGWSVTQIIARGPRAAPTDDEQTVGRVVELSIALYRKP